MKILAQPIEMIAKFDTQGNPIPVRFKTQKGNVIDVQQVLKVTSEKLAGNVMLIFECFSEFNDKSFRYELKFELQTCKWILWRA